MTQDQRRPLDDAELDRLETLLDAYPEPMDLEMLDGFLTALICSPELVTPDQYLPHILGGEADGALLVNADTPECYDLIDRQWKSVAGLLKDEEACEPLFLEYDDGLHGNSWALGFMQGMAIGGEAWEGLLDDDAMGDMLMPIFVLAHEANPDPETNPGPIAPEAREVLFEGIAAAVPGIYAYFEPYRNGEGVRPGPGGLRSVPKIGRNAPCPCGSGNKYKHCCGKN